MHFKILITQHASHLCYNRQAQGCVQRYNLTVTFEKIGYELMWRGDSKVKSFQVAGRGQFPPPPSLSYVVDTRILSRVLMILNNGLQYLERFSVFGLPAIAVSRKNTPVPYGFPPKSARFCGFGYPYPLYYTRSTKKFLV